MVYPPKTVTYLRNNQKASEPVDHRAIQVMNGSLSEITLYNIQKILWHCKLWRRPINCTRVYTVNYSFTAVQSGAVLRWGRGLPPNLGLVPQMWHETLFDELKESAYRCKKNLRNTLKCVFCQVFAPGFLGSSWHSLTPQSAGEETPLSIPHLSRRLRHLESLVFTSWVLVTIICQTCRRVWGGVGAGNIKSATLLAFSANN